MTGYRISVVLNSDPWEESEHIYIRAGVREVLELDGENMLVLEIFGL